MNYYISIINGTIEYIENNIGEAMQLADLSAQAGISDFHFNRMFKTVTGRTLKQYVLGRKLSNAVTMLKDSDKSVLDISLDLGFEYPEVFSRAFKKQYSISPLDYRKKPISLDEINKAVIVERDIMNYRGTLALKGNSVQLPTIQLKGVHVNADVNSDYYKEQLKKNTEGFILATAHDERFITDKFYTTVTCSGIEDGNYKVFCGRQPAGELKSDEFDTFIVPQGWYADFQYSGDMFDIQEVFIDDLYKWIMVKEAELNPNGIGMLNIYDSSYPADNSVKMLVPIRKPV